jgi:hypothetical protein
MNISHNPFLVCAKMQQERVPKGQAFDVGWLDGTSLPHIFSIGFFKLRMGWTLREHSRFMGLVSSS